VQINGFSFSRARNKLEETIAVNLAICRA